MCVEKGAFGLCQKPTHVKSDKVAERFFILIKIFNSKILKHLMI
jgi:hypothetical protein